MVRYAVLCGSAPQGFYQKKLEHVHDALVSAASGALPESAIVMFPNGVHELLLEAALNNALEYAASEDDGEVLLYLCARSEADLNALSEYEAVGYGKVALVRLGDDEIRKDVIAYYEDLARKMEVGFRVVYDYDGELVSEETLGWEHVTVGESAS